MTGLVFCARLMIVTLSLTATGPVLADRIDGLWLQGRGVLEPAGITRAMFRSLTVWSEGQYYLGYCSRHLPESDIAYWRNWWGNTVVPRSDVGIALLAGAAQTYERGSNDGAHQRPTEEVCRQTLDSWTRDMIAANEAARDGRAPATTVPRNLTD